MSAPSGERDAPPVLSFRGLEVRAGGCVLLRPSSVDLFAGERVLLVGPSGSGKSLLLDLLLGFAGPGTPGLEVHGEMRLDGEDLLGRPPEARDARLGAVFQLHRLGLFDDLTAAENLRFGEGDEARAAAAAAALGVGRLDRPATLCSGGERLRVAMARTILRGADVLLFDEPTTGLDPAACAQAVAAIRASHRRLTLVVTHDPSAFGGFADAVLVLDPEERTLRRVAPDDPALERLRSLEAPPPPPAEDRPRPSRVRRLAAALDRRAIATAEAAMDALHLPFALLALLRVRHALDGPRVRGELRRDLAPGVAVFVGVAAMLVSLTATFFLFDRLPRREYTEALVQDDLLAGLGLILTRVAIPLIGSILLAAKLGASTAAHLGQMALTRQVDALRLLRVPLRRHLLLPAACAQLLAAWLHIAVAIGAAYATSLVVFLAVHPGWSALYAHRAWWRELGVADLPWLAAKVGIAALAVAATAFRIGTAPKRAPEEVVRGIHRTLLAGLLLVLAVHAVFAFVEF